MNNQIKPIIATGYELELLNSMLERIGQLYEFPDSTKTALAAVSNSIEEEAVALDMIDSVQTKHGPIRRSFSIDELVELKAAAHQGLLGLQALAKRFEAADEEFGVVKFMIEQAERMCEILAHPDNQEAK